MQYRCVKSTPGVNANILLTSTPFFWDHALPYFRIFFFSFQNASSYSSAPRPSPKRILTHCEMPGAENDCYDSIRHPHHHRCSKSVSRQLISKPPNLNADRHFGSLLCKLPKCHLKSYKIHTQIFVDQFSLLQNTMRAETLQSELNRHKTLRTTFSKRCSLSSLYRWKTTAHIASSSSNRLP